MRFATSYLALLFIILGSSVSGASGGATWGNDFPKAQAQAKAEGKFVLVNFTGSDWCGWCIKLRKDVFLRPEFADYARSNLVLVEIDFPKRKTLPPTVQHQNQKLAEQFQVQAYPTLIVLDSQGTKLGRVSYGAGGPKPFISELEKLVRPQPEPSPSKPPRKKADDGLRTGQVPTAAGSIGADLRLRSIAGPKQRRRAVINDHTLLAGETVLMKLPTGQMRVRCVEIRDRSVIVTVNGGHDKRELRLTGGT